MPQLESHRWHVVMFLIAVCFLLWVEWRFLGTLAAEEEKVFEEYCANVELYKWSGGQGGWPDYKKQYQSLCLPDTLGTEKGAASPTSSSDN